MFFLARGCTVQAYSPFVKAREWRTLPPRTSSNSRAVLVKLKHSSMDITEPDPPARPLPSQDSLVFKLNASSKWLVTLVHTVAVWWRRDFVAPFIVVGSLHAVVLAEVLKLVINQARPEGAVPLDPGMPSSHSLVTSFAAAAWVGHLLSGGRALTAGPVGVGHALPRPLCLGASAALALAAFGVAALRVVNGYHDEAQVAVGAALGVFGAWWWTALGAGLTRILSPRAATALAWAAYLGLSAVFIRQRILRQWLGDQPEALV
jgi:hypothetical protein